MSNKISMYEKLGGTYTEVDGILYPNIGVGDNQSDTDSAITTTVIGKYGHLWIAYMKENHPDRYHGKGSWHSAEIVSSRITVEKNLNGRTGTEIMWITWKVSNTEIQQKR